MHILIPMWGRLRREDSYGLLTSLSLNKVTIVLVSKVRQINGGWLGFNSKMPGIVNESLPMYVGIHTHTHTDR